MKFSVKFVSLVMALIMALCAGAFATQEDDPILFTFNGQDYPASYVEKLLLAYEGNDYISSSYAYDEAIDYLITNKLAPMAKAHDMGLDEFTDEELEHIYTLADEYYEKYLDAYVEYYTAQIEVDADELREEIRSYWNDIGTTVEVARETHLFNQIKARLMEALDVEITEEEILEVYNAQIEKDKAQFAENIPSFEYFTYYLDYDVWYMPEGYRAIQQILLVPDDDLLQDYKDQLDTDDEKKIQRAAKAMIKSRQDDIDAIYARLDAGEDFVTVMQEVSEDPSMDEWVIENGYYVHQKNTVWPDSFAEASFSDELENYGDYISEPVVSKNGIHIVMYFGDVPGGPTDLTDEIRENIISYLTNLKYTEIIESWPEEYETVYNQEAIDQCIASGKAAYEAAQAAYN